MSILKSNFSLPSLVFLTILTHRENGEAFQTTAEAARNLGERLPGLPTFCVIVVVDLLFKLGLKSSVIAPAGFWPRGQNPRRQPRSPRVYTYRDKEYLLKK